MWIKLFDFDIKYILGKKYLIANRLSRKPLIKSDYNDIEHEGDVDDFINMTLFLMRAV